jgi:regulatory protein
MQITNIVQAKKDKERVNIFVDGQFALAIDKHTLLKANIYKGKEFTEQELQDLANSDNIAYLTRKLVSWCYKKPHSSKEIKSKIAEMVDKRARAQAKGEEKDVVKPDLDLINQEVLARLARQGCTDQEFCKWYVQERSRQGKYGKNKIVSELLVKGISRPMAEKFTQEYLVNQDEVATKNLQKKFGVDSVSEIDNFATKAKAIRYLRSKGF